MEKRGEGAEGRIARWQKWGAADLQAQVQFGSRDQERLKSTTRGVWDGSLDHRRKGSPDGEVLTNWV